MPRMLEREAPDYRQHPLAVFDKPIKKNTTMHKRLDDIVHGVFSVFTEEELKFEPRASSLPFCPLLELINAVKGEKFRKDYSFEFYTRVGTAIHSAVQFAFPRSRYGKNVFGNWKCDRHADPFDPCNYIKKMCKRPDDLVCPKCKKGLLEYDELTLMWTHKDDDRAFISGHCDLITKHANRFVLWEFKSTSSFNIDNPHRFLPYAKHLFQKWAYACMLDRMGMRPDYVALVYYSRDKAGEDPQKSGTGVKDVRARTQKVGIYFKVTDEALKLMRELLDETVEGVRLAQIIQRKIAKGQEPKKETVLALADARPCHQKSDYKTYMKYGFGFNEECPYAIPGDENCFQKKAKVLAWKHLNKAIERRLAA